MIDTFETAPKVLVVEPESVIAGGILHCFRKHGFFVSHATSGHTALVNYNLADIVLLDFDLPDLDGIEVCRRIRTTASVPLIAMVSGDSELERIMPLQAGADDCVTMPCGFRELAERVRAVLRRARPADDTPPVLRHGPLTVEMTNCRVLLRGRPVGVTRREFQLLHYLVARPDCVHGRRELQQAVWNDGLSTSRTIDTHVYSLRRKLGPECILTVRGIGFKAGLPRAAE